MLAAVWIGLIALLGWLVWPSGKLALLVLTPIAVFIVGVFALPVRMAPGVRMAVTLGMFGLFLVIRHQLITSDYMHALITLAIGSVAPVDFLETWSLVIALLWVAGQVVVVVVSDRVRSGVGAPMEMVLADQGYTALMRSLRRGDFGMTWARWSTGVRWSALILIGSLLLFRSNSLHNLDEDLVLVPTPAMTKPGPSHSMIVTLTTPDNNPAQYLRTALEINARFKAGGAAVVCFPARGIMDTTARALRDSLERSGAIVFDRGQFDPRYGMMGTNWRFLRFRSIDLSWTDGSPVVHPSILAASRFLHVPVEIPPTFTRLQPVFRRGSWTNSLPSTGVKFGTMIVPRWADGYSVVPRRDEFGSLRYSTAWEVEWNSFVFPANIERRAWDGPILYKEFGSGTTVTGLPDSLWRSVEGRMVFVQWVDMGESDFSDMTSILALVADMASRGIFVSEAGEWQTVLMVIVAFCAVAIFVWCRPSVQCVLLVMMALGICVLDVWVFRQYMLVTRLIYPAFVAGVAAIVLPLVRISVRE